MHQNCLGQLQPFNVHQLIILEIEFQSRLWKSLEFEVSMPILPGKREKHKDEEPMGSHFSHVVQSENSDLGHVVASLFRQPAYGRPVALLLTYYEYWI